MATVRIYDDRAVVRRGGRPPDPEISGFYKLIEEPKDLPASKVLAVHLPDLLGLLGSRALQADWTVSPVKLFYPTLNSFDDEFMVVGDESADQLEEYSRNKSPLNGKLLAELAKATVQIIWGEFAAVLPDQDSIWVTIRAIDSTFYEVTTSDPTVLDRIRSTYKDVRVADAPVAFTPIPQVPREDGN